MSSWPELSTDSLPGSVCPLWAVVISPAKWGDTTHHLGPSPLCTLVQAMITPHLPTPVAVSSCVDSYLPKIQPPLDAQCLHLKPSCLLAFLLFSLWSLPWNASFTVSPTSWRAYPLASAEVVLPLSFQLLLLWCSPVLIFFKQFYLLPELVWNGNQETEGLVFSSATSWLSALKTVTYLLWACFLTCKERVCLFAKAAIINYHRLGSLNIRRVFSHNSGD